MAVLITGGTGFVGLNLAEALLEIGEEIVFFDACEPPRNFLENVVHARERSRTVVGDVRRVEDIRRAFDAAGITHVFHGAAITAGSAREAADPHTVIDVNLMGTVNVMRAAADAGVRRLVFPSSLTVYGQHLYGQEALREDVTPPVPDSVYGITKYAAERMAFRLGELWGVNVVAGRIGSVFGPWEGENKVRDLVSAFAQTAAAAAKSQRVTLPGAYPKRELIYGRDLAQALSLLLFSDRPSFSTYNLSVDADWGNIFPQWCDALKARMPDFDWHYAQEGTPPTVNFHDDRPRVGMDTARLRTDLGFVPRFAGAAALADYAEWVEKNREFFQ